METWLDTLPEETRNAIPEDLRSDPNVVKYKDLPEFIKGHREAVATIGRKGVLVPTEKSTPEEREKFYNDLGRPAKPDLYKFTPLEGGHKGLSVTPESEKAFREWAHKNGVSQAHADGFNQLAGKLLSDAMTAQEAQTEANRKAAKDALTAKWGDKFQENMAAANAFVKKVAGDEGIEAFGDLGDKPQVLEMLHKLSTVVGEDSIAKILGTVKDTGGSSKDNAMKEIADIKANKAHAYWNENDPKHDEAVQHVKTLYETAHAA